MRPPVAEACCPFAGPMGPVDISQILDRLTYDQLREMVLIFSVRAPLRFEQLLLKFWERDHLQIRRCSICEEPIEPCGGDRCVHVEVGRCVKHFFSETASRPGGAS